MSSSQNHLKTKRAGPGEMRPTFGELGSLPPGAATQGCPEWLEIPHASEAHAPACVCREATWVSVSLPPPKSRASVADRYL